MATPGCCAGSKADLQNVIISAVGNSQFSFQYESYLCNNGEPCYRDCAKHDEFSNIGRARLNDCLRVKKTS